ncbi:unnamed protein product [Lactuca saligna]|uniref:Uncharacterized protein n=1 Tax=Lactuca saligna TaxID=75948 RepID=A0AA35Y0U7_LACSI|nr:unnamed protein product [Lactuca saligna]
MGRDPDYRTFEQCSLKWNLMNKLVSRDTQEFVKRSIRWRELAINEEIANPPKRCRKFSYSSSQQVSLDGHVGINLNDDNDDIKEIRPPPPPMGRDKTKA